MSGDRYEAQLHEIVDAVTMVSAETARVVALSGTASEVSVANQTGAFRGLADALYATRYNVLRAPSDTPSFDPDQFLTALRIANALPQRYDGGMPVQRETITGQYGHYAVMGRAIHDAPTGRQVRFYWNLAFDGAIPFVREITTRFERARIPFQAKVPVHPAGYARNDAGVLYLGDEDVEASLDALHGTYATLRSALRADVPFFTLPLAPGLAFAESPPNGDSFGMHRCDLIAEGLVQAHHRELTDTDARVGAVRDRLIKYGLEPERLAFNAGSRYPYRFAAFAEAA